MDCTLSNLLERLSCLEESGFRGDLRIDKFIEPACAAAIAAFAEHRNIELSDIITGDAASYLNLTREFHENGKSYFPLSNFDTNRGCLDKLTNSLVRSVVSATDFKHEEDAVDFEKYLSYSTLELLNNVADHSQSQTGGFVTAQFYPSTKKVQLAVADSGVGLMRSLCSNYQLATESEAIQKATEYKVTGSVETIYGREKNAGIGLYVLRKMAEETEGRLAILSNDTMIEFRRDRMKQSMLSSTWNGTLVVLELNDDGLVHDFDHFRKLFIWSTEKSIETIF